uniref:LisH domain-containing protein n=1 Tax=Cairina moschata TaxID=8855 RepID=A0A8C3CXQ1_CAIMO
MAARRAVPSDLFPLVLGFLREHRFEAAARAFAREAAAQRSASSCFNAYLIMINNSKFDQQNFL